jgi:hypothetical protein
MSTAVETEQSEEISLERYQAYFGAIDGFNRSIDELESQITEAKIVVEEHKVRLSEAKSKLGQLEDLKEAAQKSLLRFLHPSTREEMPLFDQMDDADEETHGANASEWRSEPITVLVISPSSIELLNKVGILLVGQLQDRMLEGGGNWWNGIEGLNEGIAAAIADGMAEFVNKRTGANTARRKSRK